MRANSKPHPYRKVRLDSLAVHFVSKKKGRYKKTLCGKSIRLGTPTFEDFDDKDLDGEVDCKSCRALVKTRYLTLVRFCSR